MRSTKRMFLTGSLVAIPLTFLQYSSFHSQTGEWISDPSNLLLVNALMSHAVYDADRMREAEGGLHEVYKRTTNAAMMAANCILYDNGATFFVPVLFFLHQFYTECKPYIATVKPFFVAAFWTLAVYQLPLQLLSVDDRNIFTAASVFLLLTGWSNLADVADIKEDEQNRITTPAVIMGTREAQLFSTACIVFSAIFHAQGPFYGLSERYFDLLNLACMLSFVL